MRLSRHNLVPLVAALSVGAALSACGSSPGSGGGTGSSSSVTVGLLVPSSGVYAPLGKAMKQGFELYLGQKSQKFGGHPVKLEVVDEGASPDSGVPAAQSLLQKQVNAVVGIVNSATALGVRDAFDEAHVPLIIANAGANAITGARKSDYVWRTSFSNGAVAGALGPYAKRNCKKVFLIAADYAAGKETTAGFQESFAKAGGTIAGSVFAPFGTTTNYQPFLAKIQQSGADCAYSFFAGAEAVAFTKQYADFGLRGKIKFFSSGFLTEGGVLKAAGPAALGIETSLHYSDQLDSAHNKAFVTAYTAKYNEAPTVYAVQAYDAAQVLDMAFTAGTSGPDVVKGLKKITSVDSPRGTWTFDAGHGPVQTYYLRRVVQGPSGLVNKIVMPLPGS